MNLDIKHVRSTGFTRSRASTAGKKVYVKRLAVHSFAWSYQVELVLVMTSEGAYVARKIDGIDRDNVWHHVEDRSDFTDVVSILTDSTHVRRAARPRRSPREREAWLFDILNTTKET